MEFLDRLSDNAAWEILQILAIFFAKPLWDYLTTTGTVTIKLEQSRSQNNLLNYVITNHGQRRVHDVKVKFSRAPRDSSELWTAKPGVSELSFGNLSPGERHASMFAPGTADVEPIRVDVSYANGPFFPRLGRHIIPAFCRPRRNSSATLDMSEFINFRPNVGYAGKKELVAIEEAIKDGFKELCQEPTIARITKRAGLEEVTPTDGQWAQSMPTGTVDVEEEGDKDALARLKEQTDGDE